MPKILTDLLKYLVVIGTAALALVGYKRSVRNQVETEIEKETLENEIEAIEETNSARDSINASPDKRKRLRDIFNTDQ